jgi:Flp pilus assembly protein TadD
LQLALRLDPARAEAHNTLGIALARANRLPEAVLHFKEAVRLEPDFETARKNLRTAEADLAAGR